MISKSKIPLPYHLGLVVSRDPFLAPEGSSEDTNNVWIYKGYLRRAPGIRYLGDTTTPPATSPSLPVVAMFPYYQNEIFLYYVIIIARSGGGNSIYSINDRGVWTLRHTGTYDEETPIRGYQYDNNLWIASLSQDVAYWQGTDFVTPTDYVGVRCQDITQFYNHMILLNVYESSTSYKRRIRWAMFGDATDLFGETSGYLDLDYTQGEIVGSAKIMDRLFVFKTDSIWELVYVGGETIFSAQPIVEKVGCIAVNSIVAHNNLVWFLGSNDVYVFDGREAKPIGEAIKHIYFGFDSETSREYLKNARALYHPILDEYWLAAPKADEYATDLLRYQVNNQAWWPEDEVGYVHSLAFGEGFLGTTWQEALGIWSAETRAWNSTELISFKNYLLVGNEEDVLIKDFHVGDHNGTYPEAYWASNDLSFDWKARWIAFSCESRGQQGVELFKSVDEGATWTSLGTRASTSDSEWQHLRWSFDFTAETTRFKLVWGDGLTEVKRCSAYASPRKGER